MCKGRAIAFRKSASTCEIVYRILENWSTVCENFVKEFEKTVDRFLKNCYDGHGQRNDCGVRRLKMEKNMKSKIVVDSSANVYELRGKLSPKATDEGAGKQLLAGNYPSSGATRHLPPKG